MSKYTIFDNDSKKRSSTIGKLMTSKKRQDDKFEILKMPHPISITSSPYNKIVDFNTKTKVVCQKTDLSLFLDQCKVIFVGDCEVGKSSLIRRFRSSTFDQLYKATRDVDYETVYFEILKVGYNVGIWDLSGEEKYKIINTPYYKNANVIVAVFDLTRPSSMINATRWMREALVANEKNEIPLRFLVRIYI